ncbi:MAG: Serralysin precursor [Pseudomonadota bacterium]
MNPINGTAGNDTLYGTEANDSILGLDGNDILVAGPGLDTLDGGAGDDQFYSRTKNMAATFDDGGNRVIGGAGNDLFVGGLGNDSASGDDGDDTLIASTGLDTLIGGAGNDRLYSRTETDTGDDGANSVDGGAGDDSFVGGLGNDTAVGGTGHDTLQGAEGHDRLIGGDDNDELHGAEGNDTLEGGDGYDLLAGGADDDSIVGGAANDTLIAGPGLDTLHGGDGDDAIYSRTTDLAPDFDDGANLASGGAGNDLFAGGLGNDSVSGDDGDDTLQGEAGEDRLTGNNGHDRLFGDEGRDSLDGGAGDDTADGGADDDRVAGGTGHDSLIGSAGNDHLDGQDGDDTLIASTGLDTLIGGAGNDRLYSRTQTDTGDDGANSVDGGAGDDSFVGGLGDDTAVGGTGHDTLQGAEGHDRLIGGDDNDELYGAEGNDTLDGGAGSNLLVGGEGNDHYLIGSALTRVVEQSGTADSALVLADFFKRPAGIESFVLGTGVARLPYWIDGLIPVDASGGSFATLLGPARQIGYTFPTQLPAYITDSRPTDGEGFEVFSPVQQSATARVLTYLQGIVDLQFVPVASADAPNVIALANNRQTGSAGYARYPSSSQIGSDVFLNTDPSQENADPVAGSYGALTLIHEITHALGLKHPFADEDDPDDSFAVLPKPDETLRWTVMSYDNQGDANKAFWVSSLRPLDIAALHYLYGPSASTRSGDDVYRVGAHDPARADDITLISPAQPSFIWDGGGNDRIDASQAQAAVVIALEPGYRGWIGAWAESITAAGQITVNFGTRIESLTGSSFGDRLFGNTLDNLIEGGAGNDQIAAGAGHDRLLGEAGLDSLAGGEGNDTLTGGSGADRLSGDAGDDRFEQVDSGDRAWGGAGLDRAVFNAPSTLFRARALGSGDSAQWLIDKAETGWTSVMLSGVEELVFSDRTVMVSNLATATLSATGRGLVWHWKSHAALSAANLTSSTNPGAPLSAGAKPWVRPMCSPRSSFRPGARSPRHQTAHSPHLNSACFSDWRPTSTATSR